MEKKPVQKLASLNSNIYEQLNPMDKFPPDIWVAKNHSKAKKVGISTKQTNSKAEICSCCGYTIENEELRLGCAR